MEILISIFTPAYNRADLLPRLYDSLKKQTGYNFEWIIVDDGSTDNTEETVKSFIAEGKMTITYFKKVNEGKHIAINKGVELAKGELFFIVDSDDYLTDDATEQIAAHYPQIKDRVDFAGVSFRRGKSETEYIGTDTTFEDIEASALDFRYKYHIDGDMAEVFKTRVMREFPFPKIAGERFCTEGLIWNRMALKYKLLWISKIIYIGEYLEGGLTDNSIKIRKKSPQYATLYYSEHEKMPIPFGQKIKANINFWRFARFANISFSKKWRKVNPVHSLIGFPLSLIFLLKESK